MDTKTLLCIIVAVIPVFALCFYVYKKDVEKEPGKLLAKVFILSIISVIPIIILELVAKDFMSTEDNSDLIKLFASTFMGVALIEEAAKWLVIHIGVYKNKDFNHPYDAIVYSVYASLGFALIENLLYVLSTGVSIGILRAILTVPSHACDAILMGFFLGESKKSAYKNDKLMARRNMVLSLIIPITVHALYDYLLFAGKEAFLLIFILFVSTVYIICFKLVKKVSLNNTNFDGTNISLNTNPQIIASAVTPVINNQNLSINYTNQNMVPVDRTIEVKKIDNKSIIYAICMTLFITFLLVIVAIILSTLLIN